MMDYHHAVEQALRWFEHSHLPEPLAEVSEDFRILAYATADRAPFEIETTHALRDLLRAKDCAVRARKAVLDTA